MYIFYFFIKNWPSSRPCSPESVTLCGAFPLVYVIGRVGVLVSFIFLPQPLGVRSFQLRELEVALLEAVCEVGLTVGVAGVGVLG